LHAWKTAADRIARPGTLVFALPATAEGVPAVLARPMTEHARAYVCAGASCLPEISELPELLRLLEGR
jgi:uncharacterized protein YyaL (SSP411 family)